MLKTAKQPQPTIGNPEAAGSFCRQLELMSDPHITVQNSNFPLNNQHLNMFCQVGFCYWSHFNKLIAWANKDINKSTQSANTEISTKLPIGSFRDLSPTTFPYDSYIDTLQILKQV